MLRKFVFLIVPGLFLANIGLTSANELQTVTVEATPVNKYIYFDGTVEAVQQATLFAQTSGRVIKLNFDIDDYVKTGSIIAQLRDTEQKARLNQATAGLDAAKAQLKEADLEFKRVSDLFQKNLVAASMRDKAEAGLKAASAQLDAAKARYDEAKEQLDHTVIRAPYDGTVTKRHIEVGETLQIGQPIISGVAKQDALRFNVQIPQRLIDKVRNGTQVEIILDNGQRMKSDQVTIFPTVDPKSHSFQLRAQVFSNEYRLYPGMYVKVAIATGSAAELLVPKQSIVQRSELHAVYLQNEKGEVVFRQVRLGPLLGEQQVVLAGLTAGEKVITNPNQAAVVIKTQRQGE